MISPPQAMVGPCSVWDNIPRTATIGVGVQYPLLKPQWVPAGFGMIFPKLPLWEWEDDISSSNHGRSLLGLGQYALNHHLGSGGTISTPQTMVGPCLVLDDMPRTAAMGVGGRYSLLKPQWVPAWFGKIFPAPLLWEWEDNIPSSNHSGSLLGSGQYALNRCLGVGG